MAIKRDKMGVVSITGTKWDYLLYIAVSLAVAYGFASRAIDSGSLVDYVGAIVFLVFAIRFAHWGVRRLRNS
jgi:hypothetical protein